MSEFTRIDTTANRLKIAMEAAGKIQADLVRDTGIYKGTLSNYLKGKYSPKQEWIYKLAKALDVNEMWLWGYDCPMERTLDQKKNDALADIIVEMRTDEEFLSIIEAVYSMDKEKRKSLLAFLK